MSLIQSLDCIIGTTGYAMQQGGTAVATDSEWPAIERSIVSLKREQTDFGKRIADFFQQFLPKVPKRHLSLDEVFSTTNIIYQIGVTAEGIRDLLTIGGAHLIEEIDFHENIWARSIEAEIDFHGTRSPIHKLGEGTRNRLEALGIDMAALSSAEYERLLRRSHSTVLFSVNDDRRTCVAFAAGRGTGKTALDQKPTIEKIGNASFPIRKGPCSNEFIIHRIGLGTQFTREKLTVHLISEMLDAAQERASALKVSLK